jgi:hypothetical protein
LFVVIELCIFVFSFVLFRIYSFRDKQLKKTKHLLKRRLAAHGCRFQVVAAARQPPATQPGPAGTVANLSPFAAVAGPYRQCPRR